MEGAATCMDDTKLDAPLPLIGLYITGACAICMVLMGIDTIRGLVHKRLWFPCKFFPINATTLALLSVACKLPMDLSTRMPAPQDQLTKLSGTVFICVSMCFFMPSLGVMTNEQIVTNMVALFLFVITVVVDVCTQLATGLIYKFRAENVVVLVCMLLLLCLLCSSAVAKDAAIDKLEEQYEEKDKKQRKSVEENIRKAWVMAHTSNPQYVLARSLLSTAAGALTLVCVLLLVQAEIRSFSTDFCSGQSSYRWANWAVLISQTLAVLVGSVAPGVRWVKIAARARSVAQNSCRVNYEDERFWVQGLEDWKENPLPLCCRYQRLKELAQMLRNRTLDICILLQKAVVQLSNVVCHASSQFVMLFTSPISDNAVKDTLYVLSLPGENENFLKWMSDNVSKDMEQRMEKGRKKRCEELLTLLSKSTEGFRNMCSFSDSEVTSIPDPSSKVPLNCWTLPAVTLIAIAIALSRFKRDRIKKMVNGFSQSLEMMKFVEKSLDERGLTDARRAAEILWSTIDVNSKWFHHDLQNLPINQADPMWSAIDWTYLSKETDLQNREWLDVPVNQNGPTLILGRLAIIGKKQVMEYSKALNSETPPKALAGNSLYRISMTILNDFRYETVDALLNWMEEILADIVGKCLSNLPNAMFVEYTSADAANRERRVRNAVRFLGKAKHLFESLHWSQLQEEPDDLQEEPDNRQEEPDDPECTCGKPPGFPCKHAHIKCV